LFIETLHIFVSQ